VAQVGEAAVQVSIQEEKMATKIGYMTEAQLMAFFRAISPRTKTRDMLLFKLMYTFGMRGGEPLLLKLSDFIPSVDKPIEVFITAEKGGTSRHYPLSNELVRLLRAWFRQREKMLYGHVDTDYLFITTDPRRGDDHKMQMITLQKSFTATAVRAGLPKHLRHSHVMRHTCAVHLLSKGCDLYFLKNWLRHKSLSSTIVYADLMPSGWQRMSQMALSALSF